MRRTHSSDKLLYNTCTWNDESKCVTHISVCTVIAQPIDDGREEEKNKANIIWFEFTSYMYKRFWHLHAWCTDSSSVYSSLSLSFHLYDVPNSFRVRHKFENQITHVYEMKLPKFIFDCLCIALMKSLNAMIRSDWSYTWSIFNILSTNLLLSFAFIHFWKV